MRHLVLILFLSLIFFTRPAIADDIDYTALYGKGLYTAPMAVRVQFQAETGKAWPDVSEKDRLSFIRKWTDARKLAVKDKKDLLIKIDKTNKTYLEAKKARLRLMAERAKKEAAKLKEKADEKRRRDQKIAQMKRKRDETKARLRQLQQSRSNNLNNKTN